ncbi:unnamed protein product [Rhizoctonia solani]|uniref:Uncharacterized protein n=1 Tax=Rhizoctonia solani TaxID=456999 RepID=A0A8H3BER9_9AGAM|nr:unnamed protein product [Rhizoctonia solani]
MGCASDDELDLEFEEELTDPPPTENLPLNARTIPSARTDVFSMIGSQQPITPAIITSFAKACCEELGIADGLKDDVLQTAKLPPQLMLIRLYARTVAFGKNVQTTKVDAFLSSPEFKETITRRLQAGLLDPHISCYVEGTTARFVKHIIDNPASYEIPTAVQAQFMHSKSFSSAIGKVLSTFRGELQRKLARSITDKEDIGTLASRLAIHGFIMTQEHLFRIAFIRTYYIEFTSKSGNKTAPSSKDKEKDKAETKWFWSFIDAKIEKFNKKSPKDRLSALERNIAKDRRMFPPPKAGAPVTPSTNMPEWQASVTRSVATMEGYQSGPPEDEAPPPPPAVTQTNSSSVARRPRQRSSEASTAPPPSTEPSSPINQPDIEEEEDQGSGRILPTHRPLPRPTQAHPSVTSGPSDMEIDPYSGNGQVPLQQHPPPAGTSTHTTTGPIRRGPTQRGDTIRHNPLALPSHSSAASLASPGGQTGSRTLHSRVVSASQNLPGTHYHADDSQYDPRDSDTAGAALDYA